MKKKYELNVEIKDIPTDDLIITTKNLTMCC